MLSRNAEWALALVALRAPGGHHTWNVAEPVSRSEAEWVVRIAQGLGWRGRIVESEAAEPPEFNADQSIVLSDARIRDDLGFGERHDPAEGLADNLRRYGEWRKGPGRDSGT